MQMGFYAQGTKYFIGRDSLKDSRASVLKTWSKLASEIGFTQWKFSNDAILFDNGSEIELLDLSFYPQKDPLFERFGSKEYTAGWIEEAGQVHSMAFEVLKTRIGRWMNDEYNVKKKILCTFNPKKNWVDSTFYRPFAKGQETIDTRFVYALPTDNPHLPEDYIQTLNNLKDEATKQRLLFGNFDYDDDPTSLIDYKKIQNIWTNSHVEPTGVHYIVCDVARFGSDRAIVAVFDGLIVIDYRIFEVSKITDIQQCITAFRSVYQVSVSNCIADDDGVGGGLVDNLGINGFVNNSKAIDPQYYNLQSECGYKLAEMIDKFWFKADIDQATKDSIEQELGQLKTYDNDKDGKLRTLPKIKIKENIGRSPDWLDIFRMRMWWEISTHSIW